MSDTTPQDDSLGQRLDAKLEEIKTTIGQKLDELSAKVDNFQAAIDARQGQTQAAPPQPQV